MTKDATRTSLAGSTLGSTQVLAQWDVDALIVDSIPGLVAILTPSGEVDVVNHQLVGTVASRWKP